MKITMRFQTKNLKKKKTLQKRRQPNTHVETKVVTNQDGKAISRLTD